MRKRLNEKRQKMPTGLVKSENNLSIGRRFFAGGRSYKDGSGTRRAAADEKGRRFSRRREKCGTGDDISFHEELCLPGGQWRTVEVITVIDDGGARQRAWQCGMLVSVAPLVDSA